MRKAIIVFIVAILVNDYVKAQIPRSINLEVLGVYNFAGVSFDSRFNENSKFGYKVGIGYGFAHEDKKGVLWIPHVGLLIEKPLNHVISVPLNIHYLFGKQRHFFHLGAGLTPYLINYTSYTYIYPLFVPIEQTQKWTLGYYTFLQPAYRYEAERWTGSIGLDILINTPGADFRQPIGLCPRLSIGYKF